MNMTKDVDDLKRAVSTIVDCDGEILQAWSAGHENDMVGARVGHEGVTRLEPYLESGQMAPVPFLRVWKGNFLAARLNCAHMAVIEYEE